jgi:ankyrin repeat protein
LEYGIDSNYKDLDGRTAKDYASDYGYDDILELFNSFQARGGF